MSRSLIGKKFVVTTWGESHGKAIGAVLDGCPAGLSLCEEDIQVFLDRREPERRYTTARKGGDLVEILSGVFNGKTSRNSDLPSDPKHRPAFQKVMEISHIPTVRDMQIILLTRNTGSVITGAADVLQEEKLPDR